MDFEYANKPLVGLVGFSAAREWGIIARRVFEEGRMAYLRGLGWECELRRYCDESVTCDNYVIVGRRGMDDYDDKKKIE